MKKTTSNIKSFSAALIIAVTIVSGGQAQWKTSQTDKAFGDRITPSEFNNINNVLVGLEKSTSSDTWGLGTSATSGTTLSINGKLAADEFCDSSGICVLASQIGSAGWDINGDIVSKQTGFVKIGPGSESASTPLLIQGDGDLVMIKGSNTASLILKTGSSTLGEFSLSQDGTISIGDKTTNHISIGQSKTTINSSNGLDINSGKLNILGNGVISFNDGAGTNYGKIEKTVSNGIQLTNSNNSFSLDSNGASLIANGIQTLNTNNSGQLGLGTTPNTTISAKVQVEGGLYFDEVCGEDSANQTVCKSFSDMVEGGEGWQKTENSSALYSSTTMNIGIGTASAPTHQFQVGDLNNQRTSTFYGNLVINDSNTTSLYSRISNTSEQNTFFAASGGNVGIGTSTPTSALHVLTSGDESGVVHFENNALLIQPNKSDGAGIIIENTQGNAQLLVGSSDVSLGGIIWDTSEDTLKIETKSNNYPVQIGNAISATPNGITILNNAPLLLTEDGDSIGEDTDGNSYWNFQSELVLNQNVKIEGNSGDITTNGSIKVGSASTCNSEAAGTIRFENGVFQGCTGSDWVNLHE